MTSQDPSSGVHGPLDARLLDPFAPFDPFDRDDRRRAALLDWLRVQVAFALKPQDACAALRSGISPAELWRLAPAGSKARARKIDQGGSVWQALERCGARVLPWTAAAYPARLRELPDAPPVLLIQGDVAVFERRAVAVVGARAASAYGRGIARELGRALAEAGVLVVSGLARGIDACAHRGALEAGGWTLAVQARGPDDVYPAEHRGLAHQIRSAGALLTEFPLTTRPLPAYFPLRNRIISALSEVVVVVEARSRSGSLITARHAADQGVDVLAVPGPIDVATSEGPNQLLRDGAGAVLGAEDVLRALALDARPVPVAPQRACELPDSGPAGRVVSALRDRPGTRDELGARLGLRPEELALVLAELELSGVLGIERDGRLRLVSARRGRPILR